jgi:hypothetical protein
MAISRPSVPAPSSSVVCFVEHIEATLHGRI